MRAVALGLLLVVALLLGANLGWMSRSTPTPTACVQFTEAADGIVRFTRSLSIASRRAASAAAAANTDRLTAAVVHLELLAHSFHELSPRYTSTEAACLGG